MSKSRIAKELRGFWNGVRIINGTKIANCAWRSKPWMIIENEETFEEVSKQGFVPILSFTTRAELITALTESKYGIIT